jgi:uncharacterized membrane protein YvbJ
VFCSKCGKEIDDSAVVCVNCGVQTQNFNKINQQQQPIIINNSSSSSASSSAAALNGGIRRRHSLLLDIFMICITCGIWIIWMVSRPKYN